MFALIESVPARRAESGWTGRVASIVLHAGVIGLALVLTEHVVAEPHTSPHDVPPVWTTEAPRQPHGSPGSTVAPAIPMPTHIDPNVPLPPVDVPLTGIVPPGVTTTVENVPPGTIAIGVPGTGLPSLQPHDVRTVDEMPELLAHPEPRYPEVLRQAGVEGRVVVETVLDSLGRAEPGSIRVLQRAAEPFEREAITVVLASRYRPARVNGRAVRVRIQVPVSFVIR